MLPTELPARALPFAGQIRSFSLLALTGAVLSACAGTSMPAPPPVATTTAVAPAPAAADEPTDPKDPWGRHIREAAERFDVPELWIRAVMKRESGGRAFVDGRPVTSPAGAIGLMQVMPDTYEELRWRYDLGPDMTDPRDNVLAGTAYIRELYEVFGSPGFLAAYNCGPGCYYKHLTRNRKLPAETRAYHAALAPVVGKAAPRRPDEILSTNTLVAILPDLPSTSPLQVSATALAQVSEAREARMIARAEDKAAAVETVVVAVTPPPGRPKPGMSAPSATAVAMAEPASPAPSARPLSAPVLSASARPRDGMDRAAPRVQVAELAPPAAPIAPKAVETDAEPPRRVVVRFVPQGGWKACGSLGRTSGACVPAEDLD
ncbi:lytic transglycosylase domain-containing protein [Arenibaculum pallidiluteum]|uniref:lytic transglycosylase domain-containing protein n=1 Tax=Arenibaculum pallidiluteum TaxID=2812559 RepID=UPI001F15BE1C|nr:lytic transglycosylase domain-containing protein [Arenibaculum pallidiluteum]